MAAGDVGSLVSAGVAVVAAVFSLIGYLKARGEKAEAAKQAGIATAAAVEAAEAEKRSAAAAERSAEALEEQNRSAAEQSMAEEETPWAFEHVLNKRWRLRNRLAKRAYGVSLIAPDKQNLFKGATTQDQIDGRGSFEFVMINGIGERVTVTWHWDPDLSDPERSWTDTLPRF